jgi:hypothetical protein
MLYNVKIKTNKMDQITVNLANAHLPGAVEDYVIADAWKGTKRLLLVTDKQLKSSIIVEYEGDEFHHTTLESAIKQYNSLKSP